MSIIQKRGLPVDFGVYQLDVPLKYHSQGPIYDETPTVPGKKNASVDDFVTRYIIFLNV
jgi:hypothetical protein